VAIASACSSPLASLAGGELSLGIKRFAGVNAVEVWLSPPSGSCPTLSATASVNGMSIPQEEKGGTKTGSFYFIPTTSCRAASYVFRAGINSGSIAVDGPMALTLDDGATTIELGSEDALRLVPQLVPATTRRGATRSASRSAARSCRSLWQSC